MCYPYEQYLYIFVVAVVEIMNMYYLNLKTLSIKSKQTCMEQDHK